MNIKYTGKYNSNLNKKCNYESKPAGGSYFKYTGLASPQTLATYNYVEELPYWCERIRFKTNLLWMGKFSLTEITTN